MRAHSHALRSLLRASAPPATRSISAAITTTAPITLLQKGKQRQIETRQNVRGTASSSLSSAVALDDISTGAYGLATDSSQQASCSTLGDEHKVAASEKVGDSVLPFDSVHPCTLTAIVLSRARRENKIAFRLLKLHRMEGSRTFARTLQDAFSVRSAPAEAAALRQELDDTLASYSRDPAVWLCHYNIMGGRYRSWTDCYEALEELRIRTKRPPDWMLSREAWPVQVLQSASSCIQNSQDALGALRLIEGMYERGTLLSIEVLYTMHVTLRRLLYKRRATYLVEQATSLSLAAIAEFMQQQGKAKHRYAYMKKSMRADACYDFLESAIRSMARVPDQRNRQQIWRILDFIDDMKTKMPRTALRLGGRRGTRVLLQLFVHRDDYPEEARCTHDYDWQREATAMRHVAFYEDGSAESTSRLSYGGSFGELRGYVRVLSLLLRSGYAHVRSVIGSVTEDVMCHVILRGAPDEVEDLYHLVEKSVDNQDLPSASRESALYIRLLCAREDTSAASASLARLHEQDAVSQDLSSQMSTSRLLTCAFLMMSRDPTVDCEVVVEKLRQMPSTPGEEQETAASACRAALHGLSLRWGHAPAEAGLRVWRLMLSRGFFIDTTTVKSLHLLLSKRDHKTYTNGVLNDLDTLADGGDEYRKEVIHHLRMWAANRLGRYSEVYHLFRNMSSSRDVSLNTIKMKLMLSAARRATQMPTEDNGQVVLFDGVPAAVRACAIFKQCLLTRYPELGYETHPFDWRPDLAAKTSLQPKRSGPWEGWHRWLVRYLHAHNPMASSRAGASHDQDDTRDELLSMQPRDAKDGPLAPSNLNVVPEPELFHLYLALMPFSTASIVDEAASGSLDMARKALRHHVEMLAWMRRLGVVPKKETLLLLCSYLDAVRPVASFSRDNDSAAGPLHGYLVDWLGPEAIPSRKEIGHFVRTHADSYWIRPR